MTPEQFDRWRDFSVRMARTLYATSRRPPGAWVLESVKDWFEWFDPDDVGTIESWDHSSPYPPGHRWHGECHGSPNRGPAVCDLMDEYIREWRPDAPRCARCRSRKASEEECCCEDVERSFVDQWDEQWGGAIQCCIRAGLDRVAGPSGGVIGFTAGDVRRMYPEGVPEWVFPPNERLQHWVSGEPGGTFVDLPNDAQLVL